MAAEPPPAKLDYKSRRLVGQIVEYVKSQGIFDQFRRDCIEELEQKVSLIFSWSQYYSNITFNDLQPSI